MTQDEIEKAFASCDKVNVVFEARNIVSGAVVAAGSLSEARKAVRRSGHRARVLTRFYDAKGDCLSRMAALAILRGEQ